MRLGALGVARLQQDVGQNGVGLQAVGQQLQKLVADFRRFDAVVGAPERLGQKQAQVHTIRLGVQKLAQL